MIFDEWWRVVWQIPWGHFPWWMMAIHDQTKDLPIPGIQTSTTTVEVEHCDVLVDFDLLISSRGRCGWRSDANGGGRFGRVGEAPEILKKNRWNKNKLAPGGFFPKWRFYLGGFCTWPFQGWKVTWSKPSRDQKVKEAGGKDSGWFWRCLKLPAWQGCWKVSKVLGSGMIRFRRVPIRFQQFQETNGWRARQKLEFCGVDGSYMNFVSNILPSAVRHGTWTYFERNHYDEGHLYLYSYGHRTPRCWKSTKKG